jgi:hypothetical protein
MKMGSQFLRHYLPSQASWGAWHQRPVDHEKTIPSQPKHGDVGPITRGDFGKIFGKIIMAIKPSSKKSLG